MQRYAKILARTAFCAAFAGLSLSGAGTSVAWAADAQPGAGKTVRFAQGDSLGANYVQGRIIMAGLERLGYKVALTTLNTTLFFQAAANGDLDLASDINYPQREPGLRAVEKQVQLVGEGSIIGGGVNGYLIDKKTSEAQNITRLDQLKDPKIAALFGADGKANLINCDPGWSCGDVVDYQLDKFGLKDTIKSVRGKYEALMAETIARAQRGDAVLYYAWSPSWVVDALVPGKDVVWLPTPSEALPPNVPSTGGNLIKGVVGCAGGQDPCRMAVGAWNWRTAANRDFVAKNPAAKRLIELAQWPLPTWAGWEAAINKVGKNDRDLKAIADDWMKKNEATLAAWVTEASKAQ